MSRYLLDNFAAFVHLRVPQRIADKIHPLLRHVARLDWRRIRKSAIGKFWHREAARLEQVEFEIHEAFQQARECVRDGYSDPHTYRRPYRPMFWDLRDYSEAHRVRERQPDDFRNGHDDPKQRLLERIGRLYSRTGSRARPSIMDLEQVPGSLRMGSFWPVQGNKYGGAIFAPGDALKGVSEGSLDDEPAFISEGNLLNKEPGDDDFLDWRDKDGEPHTIHMGPFDATVQPAEPEPQYREVKSTTNSCAAADEWLRRDNWKTKAKEEYERDIRGKLVG